MKVYVLALISGLVLALPAFGAEPTVQASGPRFVFECTRYGKVSDFEKKGLPVALRVSVPWDPRTDAGQNVPWTLEWTNGPKLVATPFFAQFGMHGSTGLSWIDSKGKTKRAFVAYAESHGDDAATVFWLNFDRPGLFNPPGYGCSNEAALAAGALK